MPKVAKEKPLVEITLRKYERPQNTDARELAKKICLSVGLLLPGDFRDIVCDIFLVLVMANEPLSTDEIQSKVREWRTSQKLSTEGTAASNIRRQLRRLKELYLIQACDGKYRLTERMSIREIWKEKTIPIIVNTTLARIDDYLAAIEEVGKKSIKQSL